uniref:Predicted protein n=1 Tax=Hordeum vulgare subsp. vulgare TaxID=112509 RepID=F2EHS3_HORVV|nr:predicted protein [Hordeum vulgare subsp. vulgare]
MGAGIRILAVALLAPRGGRRRDGAAPAGLLLRQLPQRGGHRASRGRPQGPADARRRRRHRPPLLPRLLRPGMRRVGHHRVDGEQHGGEGPREQPVPCRRRLRHRHQGQGGRGHAVPQPQPGVVRGHPHHGHPRRHRPGRRPGVRGGAGETGRAGVDGEQRGWEPAAAVVQPGPADGHLRREQPVPGRHDCALRGAHGGVRALRDVHGQDPDGGGGPDDGPGVRVAAARGVPGGGGPERGAGDRSGDAARLRQPVLHQPAEGDGAAHLRPGPLRRPPLPPHRRRMGCQQLRLPGRLRRRHDQPRPRRGQDRPGARQHPPRLRRAQQLKLVGFLHWLGRQENKMLCKLDRRHQFVHS